jgi:Zn-dependent M28 family amino/carboxypeptidase
VIEKNFETFFKRRDTPSVPTEFSGRSDYAGFIENGIPSGGIFSGAEQDKTKEEAALFGGEAGVPYDKYYHLPGDTIDNLAHDAFLLNTEAIADAVSRYARSFKSLPAVEPKERRWDAEKAAVLRRSGGVHGHGPHKHTQPAPCGGGYTI